MKAKSPGKLRPDNRGLRRDSIKEYELKVQTLSCFTVIISCLFRVAVLIEYLSKHVEIYRKNLLLRILESIRSVITRAPQGTLRLWA